MQLIVKVLISACIIGLCTYIGRRFPSLAGLIAVMPLTGALVLIWLGLDLPGGTEKLTRYCQAALWGILPSVLFFFTAFVCFRKNISLWLTVVISFSVWSISALIHQLLLRR